MQSELVGCSREAPAPLVTSHTQGGGVTWPSSTFPAISHAHDLVCSSGLFLCVRFDAADAAEVKNARSKFSSRPTLRATSAPTTPLTAQTRATEPMPSLHHRTRVSLCFPGTLPAPLHSERVAGGALVGAAAILRLPAPVPATPPAGQLAGGRSARSEAPPSRHPWLSSVQACPLRTRGRCLGQR